MLQREVAAIEQWAECHAQICEVVLPPPSRRFRSIDHVIIVFVAAAVILELNMTCIRLASTPGERMHHTAHAHDLRSVTTKLLFSSHGSLVPAHLQLDGGIAALEVGLAPNTDSRYALRGSSILMTIGVLAFAQVMLETVHEVVRCRLYLAGPRRGTTLWSGPFVSLAHRR